jgi:hypothetical protein
MILASLVVVALVGCNDTLKGSWTTKEVKPPENAEKFTIGRITFEKADGKYMYSSTASYGGAEEASKGTYSFDGFKLKLMTDTGKERVYDATYNSFTSSLSVSHKENGEKTTVVLTKAQ